MVEDHTKLALKRTQKLEKGQAGVSAQWEKKYIKRLENRRLKCDRNREKWNTLDEFERGKFHISYLYAPPVVREEVKPEKKEVKRKSPLDTNLRLLESSI